MRKLKFFFIGLIPGLLIVFFILNKKGASCSGYLPSSRVIAESLSKEFTYTAAFKKAMQENKMSEKHLRDSLLSKGEINFEKSRAQQEPCAFYVLETNGNSYEITFEKCSDKVTFLDLKKPR